MGLFQWLCVLIWTLGLLLQMVNTLMLVRRRA